jgi:molybdopterin synthase catalytic subunit
VCSSHRQEAFRASQWIVNELKKKVPIWKRPRFKSETDMADVVDAEAESTRPATV